MKCFFSWFMCGCLFILLSFHQEAQATGVCVGEVLEFSRAVQSAQEILLESTGAFNHCREGFLASRLGDFNDKISNKHGQVVLLAEQIKVGTSQQRCRALGRYSDEEKEIEEMLQGVQKAFTQHSGFFTSAIQRMADRRGVAEVCTDYNRNTHRFEKLKTDHLSDVIESFLELRECMTEVSEQSFC